MTTSDLDLRQRVLDVLMRIRPETDFSKARDLLEEGLLDSFDIVTLVSELDASFQISIDGAEIHPRNFRTVDAITDLLAKTLAGRSSS